MEITIAYRQFIKDIKQNIVHSRYLAARLANQEQLKLYFKLGQMLSDKANAENWGVKVIAQIADDLQQQLPGLKGFSYTNLKKMRQFYEAYSAPVIGPSVTGQLQESFYSISFSHHILLLEKCKKENEQLFYIFQAAEQFWSVRELEHHINAKLFRHQGNMPNNFNKTLPENIKSKALLCLVAIEPKRKKFKPEYAGQLNFYLNVLDGKVKLPHENPSIGIVLCKQKDNTAVDYTIKTIDKAVSVGTYTHIHTHSVPDNHERIFTGCSNVIKNAIANISK